MLSDNDKEDDRSAKAVVCVCWDQWLRMCFRLWWHGGLWPVHWGWMAKHWLWGEFWLEGPAFVVAAAVDLARLYRKDLPPFPTSPGGEMGCGYFYSFGNSTQ